MSTGPQLVRPTAAPERNWLPLAVAAAIVLAIAGGIVLFFEHGKSAPTVTPISAATDPYAANLAISNLAMSESSNLAGGKVTYLDGQVANHGNRTLSSITVQVLFRDPASAWQRTMLATARRTGSRFPSLWGNMSLNSSPRPRARRRLPAPIPPRQLPRE